MKNLSRLRDFNDSSHPILDTKNGESRDQSGLHGRRVSPMRSGCTYNGRNRMSKKKHSSKAKSHLSTKDCSSVHSADEPRLTTFGNPLGRKVECVGEMLSRPSFHSRSHSNRRSRRSRYSTNSLSSRKRSASARQEPKVARLHVSQSGDGKSNARAHSLGATKSSRSSNCRSHSRHDHSNRRRAGHSREGSSRIRVNASCDYRRATRSPTHASAKRNISFGVHSGRLTLGLADTDTTLLRDNDSSIRHRSAQAASAGTQPLLPVAASPHVSLSGCATKSAHFRVCIHRCEKTFSDWEEAGYEPPTTYFALCTMRERSRTRVVKQHYNPVFRETFVFTSFCPKRDFLVMSLFCVSPDPRAVDVKVAECVVSLQNLALLQRRKVWLPLVRHPGTSEAREHGTVLVSLYSKDYGLESMPSAHEQTTSADTVRDLLRKHAPEKLHYFDWYVGHVLLKGSSGLRKLHDKLTLKSSLPVHLCVTVREISNLTAPGGHPSMAKTCYVVVYTPSHTQRGNAVVYHRHAVLNQSFSVTLNRPGTDAVTVAVFSAGHKLSETQVGLVNLRDGISKDLTLMLVYAAGTGDAANGGQISLTLRTTGYTSPHLMSYKEEQSLRDRVQAYLWHYLRDELHRLDAILGSIDDVNQLMREWSRRSGPERSTRKLTIRVCHCRNIWDDTDDKHWEPTRCYVRVTVGPTMQCTESCLICNGEAVFTSVLDFSLCDMERDSIELMLIKETSIGDRELSRVVLAATNLVRGTPTRHCMPLVSNELTAKAHVQGEIVVEFLARDLDARSENVAPEKRSLLYGNQRESTAGRSVPETLYGVPHTTPAASPVISAAPMTVRIFALKQFQPCCDCYIKVYLNNRSILCTREQKGAVEMKFDIGDNNEATVQLKNPRTAVLTFKLVHHRSFNSTRTIAWAELVLCNMLRGTSNTVWLPLFDVPNPRDELEKDDTLALLKGKVSGGSLWLPVVARGNGNVLAPLGQLGVMLQSLAFTGEDVWIYDISSSGEKVLSASDAVMRDVTSLLAKHRPQELTRVQPLIASCCSLKTAHQELRRKVCADPIGVTVYLHIDKVELNAPEAAAQEAQGCIVVDATYGGEHQQSQKRCSFGNDMFQQFLSYSMIRLDIVDPRRLEQNSAESRALPACVPLQLQVNSLSGSVRYASTMADGTAGTNRHSDPLNIHTSDRAFERNSSLGIRRRGENHLQAYFTSENSLAHDNPQFAATAANHVSTIGMVQLSLRALLMDSLYKLGEPIRVPILYPPGVNRVDTSAPRLTFSAGAPRVAGHLIFRVTVPAFEVVPEWLQFRRCNVLRKADAASVRCCERRIRDYLTEHSPTALFDFHYKLYEHLTVASQHHTALRDSLRSLIGHLGRQSAKVRSPVLHQVLAHKAPKPS